MHVPEDSGTPNALYSSRSTLRPRISIRSGKLKGAQNKKLPSHRHHVFQHSSIINAPSIPSKPQLQQVIRST